MTNGYKYRARTSTDFDSNNELGAYRQSERGRLSCCHFHFDSVVLAHPNSFPRRCPDDGDHLRNPVLGSRLKVETDSDLESF